jgi:ribosomal protein S27E
MARFTEPQTETPTGAGTKSATNPADSIYVSCPTCHAGQYMDKKSKVINCNVCGTPIANPNI